MPRAATQLPASSNLASSGFDAAMSSQKEGGQPHNLHLHRVETPPENILAEVLTGLQNPQKSLPAKFFYDEQGSHLFDAITELEEYYPTRTETSIFRSYREQIREALGHDPVLIEPGSGNCQKVRPFLRNGQGKVRETEHPAYVPIEISDTHLLAAAKVLAEDFPQVEIHAVCADFTQTQALPEGIPDSNRQAFFPGSTIGNFEPEAAIRLLAQLHDWVGDHGGLLIGVDTKKDEAALHAAYNDRQGITDAFNRNMLAHLNRRIGADFDLNRFAHEAFYNAREGRIEMHLRSLGRQQVHIGDQLVAFADGETIHTENSYKYSPEEFAALAGRAGFQHQHCWQDPRGYFSVHYLKARAA